MIAAAVVVVPPVPPRAARDRKVSLRSGEIVFSGALGPAVLVARDDSSSAEITPLGAVR